MSQLNPSAAPFEPAAPALPPRPPKPARQVRILRIVKAEEKSAEQEAQAGAEEDVIVIAPRSPPKAPRAMTVSSASLSSASQPSATTSTRPPTMAGHYQYAQGVVYPPPGAAQPPNLEAMSQWIPVKSSPYSYNPYFGQAGNAAGYGPHGYHGQHMPHFPQRPPLTPSTMSHTLSSSGTPATYPRHQRAQGKPKVRAGRRRRMDQGPEPSSADIFPDDTETARDSPDRVFHMDALLEGLEGQENANPWDAENAQYTNMFPHPRTDMTPEHLTFSGSKLNPKANAFTGSTLNPNAEAFTSSTFNPNATAFTSGTFSRKASFTNGTFNPNASSFGNGTFNPDASSFNSGPFNTNAAEYTTGTSTANDDTFSASTLDPYADRSPPKSGVANLLNTVPDFLREAAAEILGEEATRLLTEEDKKTQDISDLQIPFQLKLPTEKKELVDDRPGVPIFRKIGNGAPLNAYEISLMPQQKPLSWNELDGTKYGLAYHGLGLARCGDNWDPPKQESKSGFGKAANLWDEH